MTPPPAPDRPPQIHSPGQRDLLHLTSSPDFPQLERQVEQLAGCTRPVRLTARPALLDQVTGGLRPGHGRDPAVGPSRLLIACGNRRASRCPTCSALYAADTYQLVRAGLVGGKTVPASVAAHPRVFATLTAPSFGPVHNQPDHQPGCRCGTRHGDDDPLLGTPLHPDRYDYTGTVLFNAHAGTLWAYFTTNLRRHLARTAGLPLPALRHELTVSFAKVAEFQKRGVIHLHAVIRLDGPGGPTGQPPTWATADLLSHAVRTAATAVQIRVHDGTGRRVLGWGHQLDIQNITADEDHGPVPVLSHRHVAAYIAKYATKSTTSGSTNLEPVPCGSCRGSGRTAVPGDRSEPCPGCRGSGLLLPLDHMPDTHHLRLVRACWNLSRLSELADLKLRRVAHMLGYRGHVTSKSRAYSTTLTALREARRTWRADRDHPQPTPGPLPDGPSDLVPVVARWAYTGGGYQDGEHYLAETARANHSHRRQLRYEREPRP